MSFRWAFLRKGDQPEARERFRPGGPNRTHAWRRFVFTMNPGAAQKKQQYVGGRAPAPAFSDVRLKGYCPTKMASDIVRLFSFPGPVLRRSPSNTFSEENSGDVGYGALFMAMGRDTRFRIIKAVEVLHFHSSRFRKGVKAVRTTPGKPAGPSVYRRFRRHSDTQKPQKRMIADEGEGAKKLGCGRRKNSGGPGKIIRGFC